MLEFLMIAFALGVIYFVIRCVIFALRVLVVSLLAINQTGPNQHPIDPTHHLEEYDNVEL